MVPFAHSNKSLNARARNSTWSLSLIQRKNDDDLHEIRFFQPLLVKNGNLKIDYVHHPIHNVAVQFDLTSVNFPKLINLLREIICLCTFPCVIGAKKF